MKDPIVQVGDPVLKETALPVPKKDIGSRSLTTLINKMKKVLDAEEYGVAIAAPQLGIPLRLFVVAGRVYKKDDEPKGAPEEPARVYINPVITRLSKKKREMAEGCLSVRGQYGTVVRHEKATIDALDEEGKPIHTHASGLLAHIFQHEVDHLSGVLFVDKAISIEPWDDHKAKGELEHV